MVQPTAPQQEPQPAAPAEVAQPAPAPVAEAPQPTPVAQPQPQPRAPDRDYYYGTGKRKSAIARVRIYPMSQGGGQVTINDKPLEQAFPFIVWRLSVMQPLQVTKLADRFKVTAEVDGGGVAAQASAVRHGISRALAIYDPGLKTELRKYGLLTRDARVKERKKYGLKRARRAPQYTKR